MVSIIIVLYNAERYLEEAIDSVLQQSFKDYEIIVVDDGSTDSTLEILQKYRELPNFKIIKREHTKNLGGNRNLALKIAKGDSIAFIDGDDVWHRNKLEIQVRFLGEYEMICSNSVLINEKNEVIYDRYITEYADDVELNLADLLKNNIITVSSVLMKKSAIENAGFFEDGPDTRAEDYILWLSYLKDRKNRIKFINTPILNYRIHDKNWSNSRTIDWIRLLKRTIEIRSPFLNDSDIEVKKAARYGCFSSYLLLAKTEFRNKEYNESRKYFKQVIKYCDNRISVKFVKYSFGYLYTLLRSLVK